MKTILVPVDLSAATIHVCIAATDLAQSIGGRLVILHIVPPLPSTISGYDVFNPYQVTAFVRDSRKAAAKKMKTLKLWFSRRCPSVEVELLAGEPAAEILHAAKRLEARYVVIGSHGHGAMYDLFVGSTAYRVIRESPCPVVLVPITSRTGRIRKLSRRGEALQHWPED